MQPPPPKHHESACPYLDEQEAINLSSLSKVETRFALIAAIATKSRFISA
jgi:hypothetical protein